MNAVVLNTNYNGLSIVQELGRRGVGVWALDSNYTIGSASRYAKFEICPDPAVDEGGLIAFLQKFGQHQKRRAVLFPTNDLWAASVSRNAGALREYYEICAPPYDVMRLILEKQRFNEWALEARLPVPPSWRFDAIDKIPESAFPVVGKPEYRRCVDSASSARRLHKYLDANRLTMLRSRTDVEKYCLQHGAYSEHFMIQRYVHGESNAMFTVGVYVDEHSVVRGLFTGRKVRGFPPGYGDCILGQSEPVPQDIVSMVVSTCAKLKYSGIAEFEFKRDEQSKEFYLIEINPRSWSWIGVTPACGVSLPWIAFQDLSGLSIPSYTQSTVAEGAVKYVKLLQDFENCLWRNKHAGYPQWRYSPRAWLESLAAQRLIVAEFSRDDFGPSGYAVRHWLRSLLTSVVRKIFLKDSR